MSSDSAEAAAVRSADGKNGAEAVRAGEPASARDSADAFPEAREADVARRIEAVERRWQSRKDRELNRARRRWESEAGQAIDPDLLAWIAEADPREVGQWLKAGLSTGQPAAQELPAEQVPQPPRSETPDDLAISKAADEAAQSKSSDSDHVADAEAPERGDDGQEAAGTAEAAPTELDVEREAEARDRLAERRSRDPSPDLFPSRGAPADAFQQIEAGFARGDVDLESYEAARRRRGLT